MQRAGMGCLHAASLGALVHCGVPARSDNWVAMVQTHTMNIGQHQEFDGT